MRHVRGPPSDGGTAITSPSGSAPGLLPIIGATSTIPGFGLTSSAFGNDQPIPAKYTCQGDIISPPLSWTGVPGGTTTVALTVVDPDVPTPDGFVHWIVTGIDPSIIELSEGSPIGTQGKNSTGSTGYTGPLPAQREAPLRLHALCVERAAEGRGRPEVIEERGDCDGDAHRHVREVVRSGAAASSLPATVPTLRTTRASEPTAAPRHLTRTFVPSAVSSTT